jgi:peptidoglycan/LPS O-acetylase OafA/YrhL
MTGRLLFLDGLRGIAALVVVVVHCAQALHSIGPWVQHGHLAVDFFFGLSGFVLSRSYADRLSKGMNKTTFLILRAIRLIPMASIGIAVATFAYAVKLILAGQRDLLNSLLATSFLNALLLPSPWLHELDLNSAYLANQPIWSLSAEMLASILFGMFLFRLNTAHLSIVAIVSGVLLGIVCIDRNEIDGGWKWPTLYIGYVRVGFSFVVGMIIQRVTVNVLTKSLVNPLLPPIIIFTFLVFLCLPTTPKWTGLFEMTAVVIAFPLILGFGSRISMPHFEGQLFGRLGDLSFPIYALHYGVLRYFSPVRATPWSQQHEVLTCLIEFIVCVVSAQLALKLVDEPIRGALHRAFLTRHKPIPSLTGVATGETVHAVKAPSGSGANRIHDA